MERRPAWRRDFPTASPTLTSNTTAMPIRALPLCACRAQFSGNADQTGIVSSWTTPATSPSATTPPARFARPREPTFPHRLYRQKRHGPLASTNGIIELRPPTLRRMQPSAARPWSTRPACECDFPFQTAVRTSNYSDRLPHCQLHSPVVTDPIATKAELPPPARDSNPLGSLRSPSRTCSPPSSPSAEPARTCSSKSAQSPENHPPSANPL